MVTNNFSLLSIVSLLTLFAFSTSEVKAQSYLPVGPQTNVSVFTVTNGGWVECYRDFYVDNLDPSVVLSDCPGDRLMLSCRETGSSTLQLLAQGLREDVTFDTGEDSDTTHIANGVGWYFHEGDAGGNSESWGFAVAGDPVNKANCDTLLAPNGDERLCWHTIEDQVVGGWRCGLNTFLDNSTGYERIVYMTVPPRNVPTLSEWGLIAMAGVLGIIGLLAIRRRKVTA